MEKIKILLIDDDELFLSLTSRTLQRSSYSKKINCISHVKEAREYLDYCVEKERPFPDIIFLDINMPGIGGLDFADLYSRRYAERFPDTKLVILSSSISRKDKAKALEMPAVDEFVQKPLTEEKLHSLLHPEQKSTV
jgi:CheY-like chemotaxis protein